MCVCGAVNRVCVLWGGGTGGQPICARAAAADNDLNERIEPVLPIGSSIIYFFIYSFIKSAGIIEPAAYSSTLDIHTAVHIMYDI